MYQNIQMIDPIVYSKPFKLYDIVRPKQDIIKFGQFVFKKDFLTLVTKDNLENCNTYSYLLHYCGNAVHMNPHLPKQ